MKLEEAINHMEMYPGLLAVNADRNMVIQLSRSGHLMDLAKSRGTYARFRTVEIRRNDWQVFTAEQLDAQAAELERAARGQQLAEQARGLDAELTPRG